MPDSHPTEVPTNPLRSRWAAAVDPDRPLPEYPRPQLRRERWQNLNGRWQLAMADRDAPRPEVFDHTIVVPFAVESELGGVTRAVRPEQRVWYRRQFQPPSLAADERLLLHFGAVDWESEIRVNDRHVGRHRGGFDPFSFDITDALEGSGEQELVVAVWDPTDAGPQPVGKQSLEPALIQYTAVTGIWQTVWLEPVPDTRIEAVTVESRLADGQVFIRTRLSGARPGDRIAISVRANGLEVAHDEAEAVETEGLRTLRIASLRPWSPEDPFLYDLEVSLMRSAAIVDRVDSYFGAREISTARDEDGIWRLFLNGEPRFQLGLLDQGWWPEGLYTAPTDEALAFDIQATKRMGFNTIRKHVKVEPARWYWHADRLGVLVWQDMPSKAFDLAPLIEQFKQGRKPEEMVFPLRVSSEASQSYRRELDAMLGALAAFPSIVIWVAFNEAWGQFDTDAILDSIARRDPSRLVDGPSGWQDTGSGSIRDYHMYNREADFHPLEADRPVVYGEFGGLKLEVPGHTTAERGWGYESSETPAGFEAQYTELIETLEPLVARGLAGAIYTQTTDVESEWNGLLSYDREVFKLAPERLAALHERLLAPRSRRR